MLYVIFDGVEEVKVKCECCGTEYDMPDIARKVIMKTCPVCEEIRATAKKLGLELE